MKFNMEEKRKMVESIISRRRSIISISREYGIDYRELKRLVARARAHGMDEVFKKKEHPCYEDSFKTAVIEAVIGGRSYGDAATQFNISYSLVRSWYKKYSETGIGSVTGAKRGRPLRKKAEPNNEADLAAIEDFKNALKEKDRQILEKGRQLERAMIENEFLKKLDALVRERIEREDGRSSR